MPPDVEYEYVKATIDTMNEKICVHHDSKLILELKYNLPKTTLDLLELELYSARCYDIFWH